MHVTGNNIRTIPRIKLLTGLLTQTFQGSYSTQLSFCLIIGTCSSLISLIFGSHRNQPGLVHLFGGLTCPKDPSKERMADKDLGLLQPPPPCATALECWLHSNASSEWAESHDGIHSDLE